MGPSLQPPAMPILAHPPHPSTGIGHVAAPSARGPCTSQILRDLPEALHSPFEALQVAVLDACAQFSSVACTTARTMNSLSPDPHKGLANGLACEENTKVHCLQGMRAPALGYIVNDEGGFAVHDEDGVVLPAPASVASPGHDLVMDESALRSGTTAQQRAKRD